MTRPLRASVARKLVRSPEPRRPLRWSIEARPYFRDDGTLHAVHDWCCLQCESGTGSAPTHQLADQAAATHWRAAHTNQETRA